MVRPVHLRKSESAIKIGAARAFCTGASCLFVLNSPIQEPVLTNQTTDTMSRFAPRVTIVVVSLETKNMGAAMKDISGTLRTIIQGPGISWAVAAGERNTGAGIHIGWHCRGYAAALERWCSVHAHPRADMDCAGETASCDHHGRAGRTSECTGQSPSHTPGPQAHQGAQTRVASQRPRPGRSRRTAGAVVYRLLADSGVRFGAVWQFF